MPHETEEPFQDRVQSWLADTYGPENVYEEKVLPVTRKRVDLYVETHGGGPDFVFETENDWTGVQKSHGQSILYSDQLDARAFIVVPEGHVSWPDVLHFYNSPVDIVPFSEEN